MKNQRWKEPGPRYLEHSLSIPVRFPEVDALGIVWHGHYVSYLEQGREALGRERGIDYLSIRERHGLVIPVVHVALDYLAPARYGEAVAVRTRLHPDERARLLFTYRLFGPDGTKLAIGLSVQVFTHPDGTLVLNRPEFYRALCEQWEADLQG